MNLDNIFNPQGLLARHLENFEFRPQQEQMANAVVFAIESNKHLLVEAGTGVGKSLSYLIPFIMWTKEANKRVVVSTYTKTLQEQLVKKDLPFLKKALNIDFEFTLCMGGQNYLCLRRLYQGFNQRLFESEREWDDIKNIRKWQEKTESGLYADLPFEPKEPTWQKVCRESDLCLGKECQYKSKCFYRKARFKAEKSQILVINHHLFFANLASGNRVLPDFQAVVFDEAHTLQDVATEYLGIEINNYKIRYFLDSIYNPQSEKGFLNRIRKINKSQANNIEECVNNLRHAGDLFFADLVSRFGSESIVQRIREKDFIFNHLKEPMMALLISLKEVLNGATDEENIIQIKSFISRGKELKENLEAVINQSLDGNVYWIEILARQRWSRYSLFAAPIDISVEFKKKVLEKTKPVIFTSATLSTSGNFEFTKNSLGIDEAEEILLNSPFDFNYQTIIYIPTGLADPSQEFKFYQKQAIEEIKKIVVLTQGRSFVLFTNYRMLATAGNILKEDLKGFNILCQGDAPRYKLLEKFKKEKQAILLGTNTFWQGVDVPGKALECVIITKLPFAVPDDPITEARMEEIQKQKKNPFLHYQIPQAIIMLRQGFGRLIRRKTDIGVVAILDSRVKTRFYGKTFLKALPKCKVVHKLEEVRKFFIRFRGPCR